MRILWTILPLALCACAGTRTAGPEPESRVFGEACEDGVCPLPLDVTASDESDASWVVADMDGDELDLGAELASGHPVALVFWQTWCSSCRREFPELVSAAERYGDSIRFVGVVSGPDDVVDDSAVRAVARQNGLPYPQVRDRDLSLTHRYEVTGTPTIVVVGPGRRTLYRGHETPEDWGEFTH